MNEVIVFLADGFEEIEGLTVVDVLRRAGIALDTVSIMEKKWVSGSHKISVEADYVFDEADISETKMLVLPGGLLGMQNLEAHEGVRRLITRFYEEGKEIAKDFGLKPTRIEGEMDWLTGYLMQDIERLEQNDRSVIYPPYSRMSWKDFLE